METKKTGQGDRTEKGQKTGKDGPETTIRGGTAIEMIRGIVSAATEEMATGMLARSDRGIATRTEIGNIDMIARAQKSLGIGHKETTMITREGTGKTMIISGRDAQVGAVHREALGNGLSQN